MATRNLHLVHLLIRQDLPGGQVGFLVAPDHFGIVLHARRVVLQVHANAVRFFNHVTIGDDVTLGINNHT